MSTHNISFHGEIRKSIRLIPLLSEAMVAGLKVYKYNAVSRTKY